MISIKLMTDGIIRGAGAMHYFVMATVPDLILRILVALLLTKYFGSTGILDGLAIWLDRSNGSDYYFLSPHYFRKICDPPVKNKTYLCILMIEKWLQNMIKFLLIF